MNRALIPGVAAGRVLTCDQGLSFWGGVDPATGRVIDAHHPWHGESVAGRVLVMPTSRGSCSGSGVLLELALNGHAPAALVFSEAEDVLTLGALIAGRLFGRGLPVLRVAGVSLHGEVQITPDSLTCADRRIALAPPPRAGLTLSDPEQAMLTGDEATRIAMEILCDMAVLQGAERLIPVTQAHIDGCIYASPANLRFAEEMAARGSRVRVPTTMNAISVDHANWRAQGVPPDFGIPASRLADAYIRMGARPSFTCAPYLLETAPEAGEAVGWAESNAVVYANSVLAARTVKHPDFLDLCIAITGRAPLAGAYLDAHRVARRVISVEPLAGADDALWPMLGYLAGVVSPDRIPLLTGLGGTNPSPDDLKALCAAFGTTSAAPMLHIEGITPEAHRIAPDPDHARITRADLARLWDEFNTGPDQVELVAIGSPHASVAECHALAGLMDGPARVATIITCGPMTRRELTADGTLARLQALGIEVISDLCWCSITEPVFPPATRTILTNSGKYAHYAPGLSGRATRFGSLRDCARAAQTGRAPAPPAWLTETPCAAPKPSM